MPPETPPVVIENTVGAKPKVKSKFWWLAIVLAVLGGLQTGLAEAGVVESIPAKILGPITITLGILVGVLRKFTNQPLA